MIGCVVLTETTAAGAEVTRAAKRVLERACEDGGMLVRQMGVLDDEMGRGDTHSCNTRMRA